MAPHHPRLAPNPHGPKAGALAASRRRFQLTATSPLEHDILQRLQQIVWHRRSGAVWVLLIAGFEALRERNQLEAVLPSSPPLPSSDEP